MQCDAGAADLLVSHVPICFLEAEEQVLSYDLAVVSEPILNVYKFNFHNPKSTFHSVEHTTVFFFAKEGHGKVIPQSNNMHFNVALFFYLKRFMYGSSTTKIETK